MIAQGEVWWADLAEPSGSELRFRRPVGVAQCDAFNRSRVATVVGAALGASSTALDEWSGRATEVCPDLLHGAPAAQGIKARLHSAGIGETTTREARARLDRDLRAFSPDLAVILFGLADAWIEADLGQRQPCMTREEDRDNLRFRGAPCGPTTLEALLPEMSAARQAQSAARAGHAQDAGTSRVPHSRPSSIERGARRLVREAVRHQPAAVHHPGQRTCTKPRETRSSRTARGFGVLHVCAPETAVRRARRWS